MTDLRNRIRAFLAQHNTMTLATVDGAGAPQAAALFYAADDALDLFFLSSPNSRHSRNLALRPRVAASIQADNQAWQAIQGLQIEGAARMVEGVADTAHAVRIYAGRFEFLRGLLDGVDGGPAALRGPLASSRFYVLRPAWIRLIDNTQGFGHKEELELMSLETQSGNAAKQRA
jgi:uncharacterized protein YhbP (UPF0306 family)